MQFSAMETLMVALLVLGAGQWIVHKVDLLSRLNMPEPVVGGLLATIVVTANAAHLAKGHVRIFLVCLTTAVIDFTILVARGRVKAEQVQHDDGGIIRQGCQDIGQGMRIRVDDRFL